MAAAASQAGLPYCFGGGTIHGPSHGSGGEGCGGGTIGFDCTGLTLYAVYQATGKVLSHDGHQATEGGQIIHSEAELQPGDLVFFGGTLSNFQHAGVYAGGGKMWDAPDFGQTVGLHNLYGGFVGGARYWSGTTGPLEVTSGTTIAGLPGRPFRAALQATGGTGSYSWSLTGGGLPTGLMLTSSGVITGTPRRPGSVPISVQVNDGSSIQTASFVVRVGATHEELYGRASDASVWHNYFDPTNGWSGWYPMGAPSGGMLSPDVSVGFNGLGNEELFVVESDGTVWHDYYDPIHDWSGWYSMGGPSGATIASDVSIGYNRPGDEELFARATDGTVWHNYFDPTNGWSGWYSMGGSSGSPLSSDISASETNFPLSPPNEAAPIASGPSVKPGGSTTKGVKGKRRRQLCTVPRLSHMTLLHAKRALRNAHCSLGHVSRPKHVRRGNALRVSRQSARAGSHHKRGYAVAVFLSEATRSRRADGRRT